LNDEELQMIFLHEMAHVRRKDVLLNYLLMAVQFLHWFNPFVWLALHRLRADRELVCDSMVIQRLRQKERIGYGKALLKLMNGFSTEPPVFFGAVPIIGGTSEIKVRILMIKYHRPASLAACLTTALAVAVLAFTACTRAPREKQQPARPPTAAQQAQAAWQRSVNSFYNGGPFCQGHAAGYWAIKLKQGSRDEQTKARVALRTMGKAAVPFFIQALHEPGWPPQWQACAASALGEIGSPASDAIPALLQMTNRTFSAAPGAALMKIRGEPIDGLIRSLNGPISDKWVETAQTLAEYGPNASEAIPALCRGLHSEKSWAAGYAIGYIHSHPEIAVPALIDAIKGGHLGNSIWALGEFEADARSAIPIIQLHLQDDNPMVRQGCLGSLFKILPPDQVNTLVPVLLKNVNDPDPNLRVVARGMLEQIDPKAAIQAGVQP
jgi:HEAT repeat protein